MKQNWLVTLYRFSIETTVTKTQWMFNIVHHCASLCSSHVAALLCKARKFTCFNNKNSHIAKQQQQLCKAREFICCCTAVQVEGVYMLLRYCASRGSLHVSALLRKTEAVHRFLHYCANRKSSHVSALLSKLKFTCCCTTVQIEGVHMLPHYCANRRSSQVSALLCKPKEFTCCRTTVQTEGVHKFLHYCANRRSSQVSALLCKPR